MNNMRIIFMGTPHFAVASLNILVENNYHIAGVITAPDKPAGRGNKLQQSAVKKYALDHNLNILQPNNLKSPEFIEQLQALKADLQIVVAFRMLPEIVWKLPSLGTFNLHASLLPQYRGAAPINWAIINGETQTGVTTFFLDHKIDTGNIIFAEKVNISIDETAGELHYRLMRIGSQLVLKTTNEIAKGAVKTTAQKEILIQKTNVKHAPKLNKENCRINWEAKGSEIYNLIRGLNPYPSAYTNLYTSDQKKFNLKIYNSHFEKSNKASKSGIIETDNKTYCKVACSDGWLFLEEIQLEGKKRMKILDFLSGFKFDPSYFVN